jgi:hypothetical protein
VKKEERFNKLECIPILSVFQKIKRKTTRFECLEVDGHKIKIAIKEPRTQEQFVVCPKCKRNNKKDSLFCIYCDSVFNDVAVEDKTAGVDSFQVKCIGCGKPASRLQEFCYYCGWRLKAKGEVDTAQLANQNKDFIRPKKEITVTVDGKVYRSTDKNLPDDVIKLMLKIEEEGYSQKTIDDWMKARNVAQDYNKEKLDAEISGLKWTVFWRAATLVGGILLVIFYVWIRSGGPWR